MASLLHHIKPMMQKLISESEDIVEKRMEAVTYQKFQAFHKGIDAFELRVLEKPAHTIDMSFLTIEIPGLQDDDGSILDTYFLSH